jgi:hypothetical protein
MHAYECISMQKMFSCNILLCHQLSTTEIKGNCWGKINFFEFSINTIRFDLNAIKFNLQIESSSSLARIVKTKFISKCTNLW